MARVFKYQDQRWEDPGEGFMVEDVRKQLATFYPELAQATANERTLEDGTVEVEFVKRAGTKGMTKTTLPPALSLPGRRSKA